MGRTMIVNEDMRSVHDYPNTKNSLHGWTALLSFLLTRAGTATATA
jgi:hypothetical protein